MKIISVNDKNSVNAAVNVILDGGIIVYPTDTLYGFGVDARNKSAIKKLNNIKRSKNTYERYNVVG
jgi:L-threonylcarbamoyladenylate synthase